MKKIIITAIAAILLFILYIPSGFAHEGFDNILVIPGEYDVGEEITFNLTQNIILVEEDEGENITGVDWDFDYSGEEQNFTIMAQGEMVKYTYLKPGKFTLAVRRYHQEGGSDIETKDIIIRGPDLSINIAPKLWPGKDLQEGDEVIFTVNVTNIGQLDAENVTVRIYYDELDDSHIIGEETVPIIISQQSVDVTIKWDAHQGGEAKDNEILRIFYEVDPDGMIAEENEQNNHWDQQRKITDRRLLDNFQILFLVVFVISVAVFFIVWYDRKHGSKDPDQSQEPKTRERSRPGAKRSGERKRRP